LFSECFESALFIAFEPEVERLATHAKLLGHLGDAETISKDAQHGVVTLFHFA
jgi:hypothetical protein